MILALAHLLAYRYHYHLKLLIVCLIIKLINICNSIICSCSCCWFLRFPSKQQNKHCWKNHHKGWMPRAKCCGRGSSTCGFLILVLSFSILNVFLFTKDIISFDSILPTSALAPCSSSFSHHFSPEAKFLSQHAMPHLTFNPNITGINEEIQQAIHHSAPVVFSIQDRQKLMDLNSKTPDTRKIAFAIHVVGAISAGFVVLCAISWEAWLSSLLTGIT